MRDAANVAWKLDLVLRELAPDALLDTYGLERGPHVRAVVELAIEMGKLICVADPAEAAARDEALISAYDGTLTDVPPFPPFTHGIVLAGSPHGGELFVQGEVEQQGRRARFDDAFGAGWQLVTLGEPDIDDELRAWFAGIGGGVVPVGCTGPSAFDADGTYQQWFADHGVVGALQRPDFALFGTAEDEARIADLVRSLRQALQSP
jgi:hypothetical protein